MDQMRKHARLRGGYILEKLINHHAYGTIPFAALNYPIIEKLSGAFCDPAVFSKT
jgi:hypothetical protein